VLRHLTVSMKEAVTAPSPMMREEKLRPVADDRPVSAPPAAPALAATE